MKREIDLTFQPYIPNPPVAPKDLNTRAAAGDGPTIDSWSDIWIKHLKANVGRGFEENSVMSEHGKSALKPCIIAGAGPSLKFNVDELVKNRGDITLVSCLHNFGFFEDKGLFPNYYVNLDAGAITIPEVFEGGKKDEAEYWAATAKHTLIAATISNPDLLAKWQGKIMFYNICIPSAPYIEQMKAITSFDVMFSVGGNTLGAALYFAKAVLGANPIAFVGADFSFGYDKKFHSWDSPYDQKYDGLVPATDVFGNRVYTWPSYFGFKCWFDFICCGGQGGNPGVYINCTEGGILGAYPEGNIRQITQSSLKEFLDAYNMHKLLPGLISEQGVKNQYQFLF